jgi:hypothetical protein
LGPRAHPIAFLISINFDSMRQRGGPLARVIASGALSRSDWLWRCLAALFGGTRLRPAPATVPPHFEAGQPAAAARCALESCRTRFESALTH